MSVFNQFFGGNDGAHFLDPRKLPRGVGANTVIKLSNNATSSVNFWNANNIAGAFTDTNFSADTYKTIVNVTGTAGLVSAIIGPVMTNATDTTTFRITVDGAQYTITVDAYNAGDRAFLGLGLFEDHFITTNSFSTPNHAGTDTGDLGLLRAGAVSGNYNFIPVPNAIGMGVGLLKFKTSLLVEIKETTAQSGTASQERRAGVIYLQMGA